MYVSTTNPNQVLATALGYQSSATAFPVSIRPSMHGNTVTYSFNPLLNQPVALNPNPLISSAAVSPMFNQQLAWNVNPMIATSGMSAWSPPVQPLTQAFLPASNIVSNWELVASPSLGLATNPVHFISPMSWSFNTIQSSGLAQMRVDLHETNSDVIVVAELPNINLNDLNLTVTDDSLSISATAFAGNRATSLFRTVALPTSVKAEQVEATYSNGILEIRAPKSDVTTRRKVKVNIA